MRGGETTCLGQTRCSFGSLCNNVVPLDVCSTRAMRALCGRETVRRCWPQKVRLWPFRPNCRQAKLASWIMAAKDTD